MTQATPAAAVKQPQARTLPAALTNQAEALEETLDLLHKGGDGTLESVEAAAASLRTLAAEQPVPLEAPMSVAALAAAADGERCVTAVIEVDLDDLMSGDFDSLLDLMSARVTGSPVGLTDITYTAVGARNGSVLLAVTGCVTDHLDEHLAEDGAVYDENGISDRYGANVAYPHGRCQSCGRGLRKDGTCQNVDEPCSAYVPRKDDPEADGRPHQH